MTRLILAAVLVALAGCQQITVNCREHATCRDIGQERGRQNVPVLNPPITNEGDVSGIPGL